jgi:hypothetical protein
MFHQLKRQPGALFDVVGQAQLFGKFLQGGIGGGRSASPLNEGSEGFRQLAIDWGIAAAFVGFFLLVWLLLVFVSYFMSLNVEQKYKSGFCGSTINPMNTQNCVAPSTFLETSV